LFVEIYIRVKDGYDSTHSREVHSIINDGSKWYFLKKKRKYKIRDGKR